MTTLYQHVRHSHRPQNANITHWTEQHLAGFNTQLAVLITHAFGSMIAFYILIAWMFGWMILASIGFWLFALDRYPFSFLLFLSNLVQLWALPVLAVGQNVLGRHAELMADEQFATVQKNDHDIVQIMKHLEAQDEELLKQTELLVQLLEGRQA